MDSLPSDALSAARSTLAALSASDGKESMLDSRKCNVASTLKIFARGLVATVSSPVFYPRFLEERRRVAFANCLSKSRWMESNRESLLPIKSLMRLVLCALITKLRQPRKSADQ